MNSPVLLFAELKCVSLMLLFFVQMNSSMYKWRIAYKCPEGENPVLTVSLFTSGVLILTALFYVCVYVWGRREQKKDMTQKRIKRSKSKSHSRSLSPDGVKNKGLILCLRPAV